MKSFFLMPGFMIGIATLLVVAWGFLLFPWLKGAQKANKNKKLIVAICTLFVIMIGLLYAHWGSAPQLADYLALQKISRTLESMSKSGTPQEIQSQFEQLEKNVQYSHVALAHMGKVYTELGLLDQAIATYNKALDLAPEQKEYQIAWIYVHSLHNRGKLPLEVRVMAEKIVKTDRSQKEILNLLAVDDFLDKHYPQAVEKWRWLLENDPELNEQKKIILQKAIASAQQYL